MPDWLAQQCCVYQGSFRTLRERERGSGAGKRREEGLLLAGLLVMVLPFVEQDSKRLSEQNTCQSFPLSYHRQRGTS